MPLILMERVDLKRLRGRRNHLRPIGVESDMRVFCSVALFVICVTACRSGPEAGVSAEAARLRSSFAVHRAAYLESVEAQNALAPATLRWLDGLAATQSRSALRSSACDFTERWARVYFGPRYIQEQMRFDDYASGPVRDTHRRMMERLREWYFVLHEYQRYGQRACEASAQSYNVPGITAKLVEFRERLRYQPKAIDEITPMLDALPR